MQQMIAAQANPVKTAQGTYDAQSQNQQQNIIGLSQALAGILGGIAPGVQKTYQTAADAQAGFAKGFSDKLQQSLGQNADNTSSFLQNIVGAPSSQVDQVRGQVAPAAAGDTLYGLRGFIPASTLNEEGAAWTAAAQQLPGIANSQGLQQIGKVQAAQRAQDAQFAEDLGKISGQAPALTRQLQNDAINQAYKAHKAALDDAKFAASQSNTTFNQKATIARINLESQKAARAAFQSDRSYSLQLAGLGIRQKSLQLKAVAQEYKLKNGGFTPTQVAHYDSLLQQGLDTLPVGTTYSQFVAKAIEHGVPVSLAVERANSHWPATQRPAPGELSSLLGISTSAAAGATGFNSQLKDYNQTVGMPVNGKVTLATGPQGQQVQLQLPRRVTPAIRNIVNGAVSYLGTPYAWGGESPSGFDCSGLAQFLYGKAGVQIPRTTYQQFQTGTSIPRNQLQAGDLVFFKGSDSKGGLPGHVGIYVGGGQFIEAPHTGDVVKVSRLAGYPGYMGARRYGR